MAEVQRQRRDVVANRARIIDAAATMLREHGMSTDMRAIAKAAGVGIGTLYRHFPTREHLVHEITGVDLTRLADSRLPPDLPAIDALRQFFTVALDHLARNRAMIDLLASAEVSDSDLEQCVNHLTGIGHEAVARSESDRTLATDITATDIAYQFLALVRIIQLLPDGRPGEIEHHVDLALRGIEHRR
ncbi:TetR/AcrR family transcriptional regulator [Phytohabitans rumicis]|uniref:TetR family transcriptional regulator n=1 Tax=Phytohabitans rumicis TaxID=1076125 RepID=A0A6V8LG39_9ACTN|nr:TetR/AcrR family transcriptional regulator [Phytohabitans rumicis]GFJ93791.1 TetR family transcriptional regulator [Phytohabitans rumicis]